MIKGTGVDIIEVERIKKNIRNENFINKVYTVNEIESLRKNNFSPQSAAGIFAAKEAVSKCMGTGFSGFGALSIEILKDEKGKPIVNLLDAALQKSKEMNIFNIQISISHIKDYAVAFAVAEGDD